MDSSLIDKIIVAVVAVAAGAFLRPAAEYLTSKVRSLTQDVPNLTGKWKGKWYIERDGKEELYVNDRINIHKQRGFAVYGKGEDENGTYVLTGKMSLPAIVRFSYEYEGKRYLVAGSVILEIDALAKQCTGRWFGYTKQRAVEGGRVIWTKIDS